MRYLGSIVCGAAASKNNRTTAAPFDIPTLVPALLVRTSAADVTIETSRDAAATTGANGLPIAADTTVRVPLSRTTGAPILAAFSTGGATIKVWAEEG